MSQQRSKCGHFSCCHPDDIEDEKSDKLNHWESECEQQSSAGAQQSADENASMGGDAGVQQGSLEAQLGHQDLARAQKIGSFIRVISVESVDTWTCHLMTVCCVPWNEVFDFGI